MPVCNTQGGREEKETLVNEGDSVKERPSHLPSPKTVREANEADHDDATRILGSTNAHERVEADTNLQSPISLSSQVEKAT